MFELIWVTLCVMNIRPMDCAILCLKKDFWTYEFWEGQNWVMTGFSPEFILDFLRSTGDMNYVSWTFYNP